MVIIGITAIAIGIFVDGELLSVFLLSLGAFLLIVGYISVKGEKRSGQSHRRHTQNNDMYKKTGDRGGVDVPLSTQAENNLRRDKQSRFEVKPPSKVAILQSAIMLSMDVKFRYTKKDGEVSCRNVKPKRLFNGDYGVQYLRAYDYMRKAERTFRISRIDELE